MVVEYLHFLHLSQDRRHRNQKSERITSSVIIGVDVITSLSKVMNDSADRSSCTELGSTSRKRS